MLDPGWLLLLLPAFALGGGAPSAPPPAAAVPQKSDTEIQAERARAAGQARRRKGRAATILGGERETGMAGDRTQVLGE